jgi:hypothetical protein
MGQAGGWKAGLALAAEGLRIDLGNFHLAHYRHVDGFLVSAKNSGTHWLKCMLSHALARQYDLPPPQRTSGRDAEDFIGHPRWPHKHRRLPRIGSSHNLPSALLTGPQARRLLGLPPIVVLVRGIPEAMLSHWVKWGPAKGLSLTDYVRLPARGRRDVADVWWYLEFFNRWGRAAQACPADVLVVRYEDVLEAPALWLRCIAAHLGFPLSAEALGAGLDAYSREFVAARLDPAYGEDIVPDRSRRFAARLSPADEAYLRDVLAERLRYEFGYGHAGPGRPVVGAAPARSGSPLQDLRVAA